MNRHIPILVCCILPLLGIYKLSSTIDWQFIISYCILISIVSIGLNWLDKRRAENTGWRISEKGLHICEFLGGWPAAYLAQQILRHKTNKRSYRVVFWCIVALYQLLALEWITEWRISHWVSSRWL